MNNFSDKIIQEIEGRNAEPKPRWHFLLKRSVFWTLAGLSVLVGGVAVSVTIYVFFDNDGLGTAQNPAIQEALIDLAQSIPYVWLFVLGLFTASAYLIFRKTRKGYRYATTLVIGAVIGASILFGLFLDAFDFGQVVHKTLQNYRIYDVLIYSSEDRGD